MPIGTNYSQVNTITRETGKPLRCHSGSSSCSNPTLPKDVFTPSPELRGEIIRGGQPHRPEQILERPKSDSLACIPKPKPSHPWYPDGVFPPKGDKECGSLACMPKPKPSHPWYPDGILPIENWKDPDKIQIFPDPKSFW